MLEAQSVPRAINNQLRRFLTRPDFINEDDKANDLDYDATVALLTGDHADDARVAEAISGIDADEVKIPFIAVLDRAIQYLRNSIPRRARVTFSGPRDIPPSDQERSRFARTYAAVDAPMTVLADLNEGTISREQVAALGTVYPEMYALIKRTLFIAMADMAGKRPGFELSLSKERVLGILLDAETMSAKLAKELQDAFATAKEQAAASPPPVPRKANEAHETSVQRIANK